VNRIDPSGAMEPRPERSGPTPDAKATTAQVFAVFASAWPRHEVTEPTLNLWAHQIGHLPEAVALEAAVTIVRTSEWWPSIRRFVEVANGVSQRRSRSEHLALPEARDVELGKSKIAEIRQNVAEIVAEKKHGDNQ
jgi:hypothetical protein